MSEIKLNLIDSNHVLTGTIHGSDADRCIAALSAEPETTTELWSALARYHRRQDDAAPFAWFHDRSEIDPEPWDAGIMIIDLAARVIASESTYCDPSPEGEVHYHDGEKATDIPILYRLPADWLFVRSVDAYQWARERRLQARLASPAFDARAILYGPALLEFIVESLRSNETLNSSTADDGARNEAIVSIHREWLMTPRDDLRRRSPRDVLLEKRDFIDFDLHTRSMQWTFVGEGPPCLATGSFAYRFAGFGTHEWVVYYDLVRHLLWQAAVLWSAATPWNAAAIPIYRERRRFGYDPEPTKVQVNATSDDMKLVPSAVADGLLTQLEKLKTEWLEQPNSDLGGRSPANIIHNERRRLPEAMGAAEIMIDEDCEWCRMAAQDAEMGFGPTFWHLDGCNMEEEFAFSPFRTVEEWEAQQHEFEEFSRKYEEREQRRARGELVDDGDIFADDDEPLVSDSEI